MANIIALHRVVALPGGPKSDTPVLILLCFNFAIAELHQPPHLNFVTALPSKTHSTGTANIDATCLIC